MPTTKLSQIFKEAIMKLIDNTHFSEASLDVICDTRLTLDNLKTHLDRCKKVHSSAMRSITRIQTIVDYTIGPDEKFTQETRMKCHVPELEV